MVQGSETHGSRIQDNGTLEENGARCCKYRGFQERARMADQGRGFLGENGAGPRRVCKGTKNIMSQTQEYPWTTGV